MPAGNTYGLKLSQADLDSLTQIGKNFGRASTALEVGMGLYEFGTGQKTLAEAGTEVGGSLAGAYALGKAGAALGALGGPAGAFILGTGGAVGKAGAEKVYDYFNAK